MEAKDASLANGIVGVWGLVLFASVLSVVAAIPLFIYGLVTGQTLAEFLGIQQQTQ